MNRTAPFMMAWLAAAGAAFGLAVASPNESSVMGEISPFEARTPMNQNIALPQDLPSGRTLALITFSKAHHTQAESWIEGMNLRHDSSIAWVRIPVIEDPGTSDGRSAIETRLRTHYAGDDERVRLLPAFVDRLRFTRAAGLTNTGAGYAVVLNQRGEVLARAEGHYNVDKAQALRETLAGAGAF
jgi:hypothetical protein